MRKVLFSFLGMGDYESCYYTYEGKKSTFTRFIQTAIYEHTLTEGPLEIIVFATKEAKAQNWAEHLNKKGEWLEGLEKAFARITPGAKVKLVDISSSQDEEANWNLFDIILSQIKEGDEIYFDMTHSFRSIPLVSLIVLNYARLVKKAKINKLMYGLFDRNQPEKLAPIIDVTSMLTLLDWTNGVDQFIRTGDASLIKQFTNDETGNVFRDQSISKEEKVTTAALNGLTKQLDIVGQSFQTCRSLVLTDEINKLKQQIETVRGAKSNKIKPLVPLLTEIESKYENFGDDKIMNGLLAAEWCVEHRLIQPGITLLQESCVTAICYALQIDPTEREKRKCINPAIKILMRNLPEKRWTVKEKEKPLVREILAFLKPYREQLKPFDSLSDYRNDINHAGTNSDARKAEIFLPSLKKGVKELRPFFEKMLELTRQQV
ncbi:TIGR02221 family CRISPR-associated protein [Bacillus sp. DTU_2020_1000418_1_SI_GHA_SEK_038]|uniref:TIGR02221 family CRISPR-associated protein n=1 Tax=Bacillus sp. DTU_2020_1000418_1_SI_GHA_SEK_038 TaxID=3077585 RepID=UPI0028EF33DE|nr:TIGR02221 family CRISPR-associated protein [Bacillus sp. DTU_2020_1000418_1_SI_GHA_SEK_038]WNS77431.1 TIGR02221 family CRISPR-associated protein [Bacillus sp. DTU_2020_1000418_1_SI_GHA_SEK_038]